MSDTPIAERLAADLGMPWPLWQHMHGSIFDFFGPAAGSETGALADPHQDAAPPGPAGAASTSPDRMEGTLMSKPTPEQLKQMRDGATQMATEGRDVTGMADVYDLVSGEVEGPGDN